MTQKTDIQTDQIADLLKKLPDIYTAEIVERNEELLKLAVMYDWDIPSVIRKKDRKCCCCSAEVIPVLQQEFMTLVFSDRVLCKNCSEQKQIERGQKRQQQITDRRLAKANIPKRFLLDADFDKLHKSRKRLHKKTNLEDHLWIVGNPRTGKTYTAVAFLKKEAEQREVKFFNFSDLFGCQINDNIKTINEATKFQGVVLLDDIRQLQSSYWMTFFDDFLRYRYDNMLSTIITSNLSMSELEETLEEKILLRVQENSCIAIFKKLKKEGDQ